ncbi:glycosyl hydrolase [Panacibacter ginsenosidivorans]|uniref:Glycosyl hydrolase n=1 Tax=Panacibacter ginsenosidivorans TaxID=1813871 RepID=A0A5B8VIZ6_9BACT|nr:glycosyl hydrolase [Panacibacter ginsenosidivorans]
MDIRAIAIYLPQFHPIPENDAWWGKGFTEWTNVTKAKPLFEGHYQPHLPADLGFYDLRIAAVREAQAKLAAAHGIYGFCYYHYWFNGKQLLERPFKEVFESGRPDFPFMLCWANENWTRVWDGGDKEILMQQEHSAADDIKHIQTLLPYFKDKRYIKVNGKPVLAIYRSALLPDIKNTLLLWRKEAAKEGMELYICRFESFDFHGAACMEDGFDAAIDFEPLGNNLRQYKNWRLTQKRKQFYFRWKDRFYKKVIQRTSPALYKKYYREVLKPNMIDYADYAAFAANVPLPNYTFYPCVSPMWDNSARRKKDPIIFYNSSPEAYKSWLESVLKKFKPYSKDENFVFINAWNEWAEGNHLEPCAKWGRQYLQATKDALETIKTQAEKYYDHFAHRPL